MANKAKKSTGSAWQDSTYQTTASQLTRALAQYQNNILKQRTDYTTAYGTDLKRLGYNQATNTWNRTDPLTSSGKAYTAQNNDFAARGMLQSTGYADADSTLGRAYSQQLADASTAKQKYFSDLDAQSAAYKQQTTDTLANAKLEAIARKQLKYNTLANGVIA